jgi:predicted transporter
VEPVALVESTVAESIILFVDILSVKLFSINAVVDVAMFNNVHAPSITVNDHNAQPKVPINVNL